MLVGEQSLSTPIGDGDGPQGGVRGRIGDIAGIDVEGTARWCGDADIADDVEVREVRDRDLAGGEGQSAEQTEEPEEVRVIEALPA